MSYALNEVEATAKKAARGAGYSWGHAEETAKATRWLCAQGLDGCAALAGLLGSLNDGAKIQPPQDCKSGDWQAAGDLCPLTTGAALSDFAFLMRERDVQLSDTAYPELLLPFAAMAAKQLGMTVSVTCNQASAVTDGTTLSITGRFPARAAQVTISHGKVLGAIQTLQTRATPNDADWSLLNTVAHRTYAPATEASRRLGAGTEQSDND